VFREETFPFADLANFCRKRAGTHVQWSFQFVLSEY
jgi:hypothetical protein